MGNSLQRQFEAIQGEGDDEALPFHRLPVRTEITRDLLQDLERRGLDVDLALNPFQMKRIEEEGFELSLESKVFQDSKFVQSPFNIQKNSFHLDGKSKSLKLTIDCTASCKVGLNYSVKRPLEGAYIRNPQVKVTKGIGQIIDLECDMKELERLEGLNCSKDFSPLVILCDLMDSEASQNSDITINKVVYLLSISIEGSVKFHVDSQYVYISDSSKVNIYQIKDLYGKNSRRRSSMNSIDGNANGECVICMSNTVDTAALPCRHFCLCRDCATLLRTKSNKCPVCRSRIVKMVHVQNSDGEEGFRDYNTFPMHEDS
jgi:hypothetical protein